MNQMVFHGIRTGIWSSKDLDLAAFSAGKMCGLFGRKAPPNALFELGSSNLGAMYFWTIRLSSIPQVWGSFPLLEKTNRLRLFVCSSCPKNSMLHTLKDPPICGFERLPTSPRAVFYDGGVNPPQTPCYSGNHVLFRQIKSKPPTNPLKTKSPNDA